MVRGVVSRGTAIVGGDDACYTIACASIVAKVTRDRLMRALAGRYPVELFGRSRFPRIGQLNYLLTPAPRGFFWFQLVQEGEEAI